MRDEGRAGARDQSIQTGRARFHYPPCPHHGRGVNSFPEHGSETGPIV